MATFQKLTDVAVAEVVSEQANVFIEDGGELKRVAKSQVGGAGSLADLKDVVYFHFSMANQSAPEPMSLETETTDSNGNVIKCNKTFDEILDLILTHELKMVAGVVWYEGGWNQANIHQIDWWLSNEDKVFDNTATCINFAGSVVGEAGEDTEYITWHVFPDNSIEMSNSNSSGMPE